MSFSEAELEQLSRLDGVEPAESCLSVENFSAKFLDKDVFFQVVYLKDSYFIWIGEDSGEFYDISLAVRSRSFRSLVCSYWFEELYL